MESFMTMAETSQFLRKLQVGATPLMVAAKEGDLERCLQLLKQGGHPEEKTELRVSLLHFAAVNKMHGFAIIQHFVSSHGLSLAAEDVDGEDALEYALRTFNFKLANLLQSNLLRHFLERDKLNFAMVVVERNPSLLRVTDSEGRNPLHLAVEVAGPEICDWLMRRGVDPRDVTVQGATVLHHAVRNEKHGEVLVLSLSNLLDVNAKTKHGETPLHWALLWQNLVAAQALLKVGAKVGQHILQFCIANDRLESARFVHTLLPEQVFGLNFMNKKNALHVAAECSTTEMCQWLLEKGIRSDDAHEETNCIALHYATLNKLHGPQVVHFLLSIGLDIDAKDVLGQTPLFYALRAKNLEVARALVRLGANVRVEVHGLNLLHYLVCQNDLKGAQFVHRIDEHLIERLGKGGRMALHLAAEFAGEEMCRWLLEAGARLMDPCKENGYNVMHCAVLNEQHARQLVRFFHSAGVDEGLTDSRGYTPLHVALEQGNLEVVEVLVDLGANLEVRVDQSNLLHFCVMRNKFAGAKFVHERRKHLIKESNIWGMTALHLAAHMADLEFSKWLVEEGVDTKARNVSNLLAWQLVPHGLNDKLRYFKSVCC
ncbi:Hypothetical predicted protein [Cloeon dipterum]|uniref:Uncharacterized protein n=1 Tax=Cloeon dipterum TaxID=197152 RepID=A0A8S1DJ44_9INSE|nr:Hypothetical predicted protein [Cloeon dipterum]